MDKTPTRGPFLRDLVALVFLIGSAIQLIGNFDALLQLSKFAKWLVDHWIEFIELPLRQLLLQWGLRVPPNIISLLIINILPTVVLISVALQFFRTLPASPGEPKLDMKHVMMGIPYRRMRFVLGFLCLLVLICVVATQIIAHASKTLRSITDAQIYSCFVERNERICRDYFFIRDISEMPAMPTSGREDFVPVFRQVQKQEPFYYVLMSDGLQIVLLVIFALSAAYLYFYRYWVARLIALSEVSVHASHPRFHHGLVARLSFLSVVGTAYARIILVTFALLGLSLVVDLLPDLVQRLTGLL